MGKHYNYNPEYNSFIKHNEIKYPENTKDCQNRMIKVIKHIIEKYYKTDLNILVVTHQGLCDAVLKIINKFSSIYKHKLSNEISTGYQKGKVTLIFDNDWTFKKLN